MKPWLVRAAIVIAFLGHAVFYFAALGYDAVDDAYISFRYAQNVILGHGLVFNAGERVEGFTNFLWTALMIPVVGAGADVGRFSIILGVLFGVGTLWLTVQLARSLRLPNWVGYLAAFLLAVDGSFAIWSVGGLETAMFAFLLTSGATFYMLEQRPKVRRTLSLPPSGILFALAALTRPEAAAVFALTAGHQFLSRAIHAAQSAAKQRVSFSSIFPRTDILRVVGFGSMFIPYWLLRWWYYHSFFPNSFYAKVAPGGPIAQLERGWHYVTQFVDVHLGWWIVLPAVIALLAAAVRYVRTAPSPPAHASQRGAGEKEESGAADGFARPPLQNSTFPPSQREGGKGMGNRSSVAIQDSSPTERRTAAEANPSALFELSYLTLVTVAYGVYIVYVGGDWSVGRFFVPVLPFVYLAIAVGLAEIYGWVEGRVPAYLGATAAALLLGAIAFASSWNGEYGIFVRGFDAATATEARVTMGRWLKSNVPPGTWIAVDAAGEVPYFSGLPAIDMFGINDLHIGRLSVPTLGTGTPGHEKFDLGYIIARAPRFVIIYGNLFDSVTEYRRVDFAWTSDEKLKQFLTIYERK